MGSSMLSDLEFDQNPGRAQDAAACGPVFIMDGGRPSYVLITIDDYHRLVGRGASIVDLLSADEKMRDRLRALPGFGRALPTSHAGNTATVSSGGRLVHGMTVVTRNVPDFSRLDLPLLDPWQTGTQT